MAIPSAYEKNLTPLSLIVVQSSLELALISIPRGRGYHNLNLELSFLFLSCWRYILLPFDFSPLYVMVVPSIISVSNEVVGGISVVDPGGGEFPLLP